MPGNNFSQSPVDTKSVKTKFRTINTPIPVPESLDILNKMYKYESNSMHGQMPIIWDKADDFQVYDCWGNKWIDFTSTIFVSNAGHGNKKIVEELTKTINKPLLHTYTYPNIERINYLEYLIKNTPDHIEKAFLLSSGTEANEAALKLMRLNGAKYNKNKKGIICFDGSYHGRTVGSQLMTGNQKAKEWIGHEDPNIYHLPFPYPWIKDAENCIKCKFADCVENCPADCFYEDSIKKFFDDHNIGPAENICGIVLETFQGWGAIFYPLNFVKKIRKFCDENNILLTFDEVQAGFARTGKLFGYMHYEVTPDLVTCGKGVSSGLPLSLVLGSQKVMDLSEIGSMSSTHSANPLSSISGHHCLKEIIDRDLVGRAKNLGEIFHNRLNEIKEKFPNHLKYIFGKGMIAGLVFIDENNLPLIKLCDLISEEALRRGLIVVHTGRESIKLGPPITIHEDALMEGLQVLEDCINDLI